MSCTELPRAAREDILRDIATWPLALEDVAHRQTRLRRNGNGDSQTNEENASEPEFAPAARRKRERRQKTELRRLHHLARRKAKRKQTAAVP